MLIFSSTMSNLLILSNTFFISIIAFFIPRSFNFYLYMHAYTYIINVYFWLHWAFVTTQAFSSCIEHRLSLVPVCRLLMVVASPVAEHGPQAVGLQKLRAVGSVVMAHRF